MFFHSQTEVEQHHIIKALRFELGKCINKAVPERMLYLLSHIDDGLANQVALGLGMKVPKKIDGPLNMNVGADTEPKQLQPKKFTGEPFDSPALSIIRSLKSGMKTAKVAVLVANGFDAAGVRVIQQAVTAAGGQVKIIAPHGGIVSSEDGAELEVDFSLNTVASVLFDAVYVAGGEQSIEVLSDETRAVEFIEEACKHCKAIAATGAAVDFLNETRVSAALEQDDAAVAVGDDAGAKKVATAFVNAISQHRNWQRELSSFPTQ
jgi:catalase